jgi:hypothetical protein
VCSKVHQSRVNGVSYDSLTNVVFSASQDKIFRVSHGSSLAMIVGVPHKEQLLVMLKDQINKRIFVASKIGEIIIYDISQVHVISNIGIKTKVTCYIKKQQRKCN